MMADHQNYWTVSRSRHTQTTVFRNS